MAERQESEEMPSLNSRADTKFARLEAKIDAMGIRLDARMDGLEAKADRHFTWLVGIQVTALAAFVGALFGR